MELGVLFHMHGIDSTLSMDLLGFYYTKKKILLRNIGKKPIPLYPEFHRFPKKQNIPLVSLSNSVKVIL